MWFIVKWIWQLPQHIAALLYYWYLIMRKQVLMVEREDAYVIYTKNVKGSVTLGMYIFLSYKATKRTLMHEIGHTRQSLYLGPLYLIIIGLPSLTWAIIHSTWMKRRNYYNFYTEKWANRLGGVE